MIQIIAATKVDAPVPGAAISRVPTPAASAHPAAQKAIAAGAARARWGKAGRSSVSRPPAAALVAGAAVKFWPVILSPQFGLRICVS